MHRLALAVLALAASGFASAQSVGLVPGQPTVFTLPASAYTTGLHFDVPAGATSFKVELESDTPNVDIDLFLRYGNPCAPCWRSASRSRRACPPAWHARS